jgi:hypothetical protein
MASVLKVDTIKSLTGNEAMTISEAGVATFAAPTVIPSADVPHLIVGRNSTAGIAYNAWTQHTSGYNTPSNIGGGTFSGGVFTPNVPGLYMIVVIVQSQATTQGIWGAAIFRNNGLYRTSFTRQLPGQTTNEVPAVSGIAYLNGTSDTVGAGFYVGASSGISTLATNFDVCLLQRTA